MIVAPGTTSVSITVQIVDDSGLPVTALVANTFPTTYYARAGESLPAAITLSDLAAQNSAYVSGGVKELTGGYYRLDVPDAAFTTANRIRIIGEATGKRILYPVITCMELPANVRQLLGTAWLTPATPGTPDVNAKTVTDKAGYSLSQAFPANFALLSITPGGAVTAGTVSDKSGYSLAADQAVNVTKWGGVAVTGMPLPTGSYTAPPSAAAISVQVTGDLAAAHGAGSWLTATGFAIPGDAMSLTTATGNALVGATASAVWDVDVTQHNINNSTGLFLQYINLLRNVLIVATGTVNDVAPSATSFKTTLTNVDSFWDDALIVFRTGALTGQHRPIFGFASANGVITLDEGLTSAPANGDTFSILTGHVHPISQISSGVLAAGNVDGYTLEQTLKLCLASLVGKLSGAGTTTIVIRAANDSKTRITATVDTDGNRSLVTLDGS